MRVPFERLDLCELLRDVVQRVPGADRDEGPGACRWRLFIKGDAQRLEQVLANLLSNALKYGAPDTELGWS